MLISLPRTLQARMDPVSEGHDGWNEKSFRETAPHEVTNGYSVPGILEAEAEVWGQLGHH